jgi:hypothetical protein
MSGWFEGFAFVQESGLGLFICFKASRMRSSNVRGLDLGPENGFIVIAIIINCGRTTGYGIR